MDAQKLAEMLETIRQQGLNLHSLLIIRNGHIVSETYFGDYGPDTKHELYSCTKSFISTLVGIALDQGKIDGVKHRVLDLFAARTIENREQLKDDMTLEDLLTMRAGLEWQEGDPIYREMYRSSDWVGFVLNKPMTQPPGHVFNYCSGCSHLLSALVQQTTQMNTRDFAEQNLFKPLGISRVDWDTDSAGTPIGGWGLQLTPRDMAKLGYLFLREGKWDGRQIISAGWVKAATQKHAAPESEVGYGYQWWTYPALKAYAATGRYGQAIIVIPEMDLIIVTTAGLENHEPIFRLIEQYIIPAVQKSQ
jgi:CubicO group peptidase (beta-lactamase class C family)